MNLTNEMSTKSIIKERSAEKKLGRADIVAYLSIAMLVCLSMIFFVSCIVGIINPNWVVNELLYVLLLMFWFLSVVFCFSDISKHLLLFLFLGCFFSFLMARNFMTYLQTGIFNVFTKFHEISLNVQEYQLFVEIMYLSLSSIVFSYYFFWRLKINRLRIFQTEKVEVSEKNTEKLSVYHVLSKWGFYICFPFQFYANFTQLMVRRNTSYGDSFTQTISLPIVVRVFVALFFISFVLFLATKPKKREMLIVFALFFGVEGVIPVLGGGRINFAMIALFFIWYANRFDATLTDPKQKILKKSTVLIIMLGGIFIIVLFSMVEFLRGGSQVNLSFTGLIYHFFDSLGGSDGVLANFIQLQDQFPEPGYKYFFNGLYRLFDNSVTRRLVALLTGTEFVPIPGQGAEFLEQFHDFASWLTSFVDYDRYIAGGGMGSAYMAETYFAFGLIGVIVYGILLGTLIGILSRMKLSSDHIWRNVFLMFLCFQLFVLPRSAALVLFDKMKYFAVGVVIYYLLYKLLSKDIAIVLKKRNSKKAEKQTFCK